MPFKRVEQSQDGIVIERNRDVREDSLKKTWKYSEANVVFVDAEILEHPNKMWGWASGDRTGSVDNRHKVEANRKIEIIKALMLADEWV